MLLTRRSMTVCFFFLRGFNVISLRVYHGNLITFCKGKKSAQLLVAIYLWATLANSTPIAGCCDIFCGNRLSDQITLRSRPRSFSLLAVHSVYGDPPYSRLTTNLMALPLSALRRAVRCSIVP